MLSKGLGGFQPILLITRIYSLRFPIDLLVAPIRQIIYKQTTCTMYIVTCTFHMLRKKVASGYLYALHTLPATAPSAQVPGQCRWSISSLPARDSWRIVITQSNRWSSLLTNRLNCDQPFADNNWIDNYPMLWHVMGALEYEFIQKILSTCFHSHGLLDCTGKLKLNQTKIAVDLFFLSCLR